MTDTATKSEKRTKIHPMRTLRLVLLGVALCAVVGGACFFAGRSAAGNAKTQLSAVVLQNQLNGISELASVSYTYTNMAQFESSNDFYGVTVPFTTKRFILTYDGIIKAGVDLTEATVTVAETGITIHLPKAKILSHEIDQDSVEIFNEKTSIFNPFTVEDFTAFQADQEKAMEARALERGLLTEAAAQGEKSVRLLLSQALPEGTVLTVK